MKQAHPQQCRPYQTKKTFPSLNTSKYANQATMCVSFCCKGSSRTRAVHPANLPHMNKSAVSSVDCYLAALPTTAVAWRGCLVEQSGQFAFE